MKKFNSSPWLMFSPFLLAFILFILKLQVSELVGDEGRYLMFANNLSHGFYSPPGELNLWNGPGYPLILSPFVALGFPVVYMKLLNAFFQYFSIVFLYKSISLYSDKKKAVFFTLCWALYFVAYQEMSRIMTEPFTSFLIVLIIFFLLNAFKTNKLKYKIFAGFAIGFLVLTKISFGYVLLTSIFIYGGVVLINMFFRKKYLDQSKKILAILAIALLTTAPYLCYTYSLTGRVFYLGNSGGMTLYWMSTPYENEYGEWNSDKFDAWCKEGRPCNADSIRKNHQQDFDIINKYTGVEKDDMYKKIAVQNIKTHPLKYLRNIFSNLGRLWFGYPISAFYQQDVILIRFIPNSILLTFFLITLPLWLINFNKCRYEINFLMIFIFLYLGASSIVSAYPRQLYVVVPALLIWFSFILPKAISFRKKI